MPKSRLHMMDSIRQDAEIWNLFTRKEEYGMGGRDRHDRFPYYRSCCRDIFEPRASKALVERGYGWEYPDAQPFTVCLTHDIDRVYEPLLAKGFDIGRALKGGDLSSVARITPQLHSRKRPWWNFQEIVALEGSYGACSSFHFLALEEGDRGYSYAIEDLEQEICMLEDQGWEVSLHGGCDAYNSLERLKSEKKHLERVLNRRVVGYRGHFLKFQVPETWELLEQAGFLYDTTLGYPDCVGFRNGMCHPFRPFNLNTGREMEILEIPLVIMDRTLLYAMQLNSRQAWDQIKQLLNTVEQYHGAISILWHNDFMTGEPLRIYEKILKHCREKGAWMTSCREVEAWLRKSGVQA